jgi:hypothetical protein
MTFPSGGDMLRTQIQLTEEQHRMLRAAAVTEGVSISEMVRRCVSRFFREESPERKELYARAAGLVGTFDDPGGATDLSVNHDEYLDEAFAFDEHFRREGFPIVD